MFTTLVMRDAIAHEGRLCRPDNLNSNAVASGGGREGGLPPPANVLSRRSVRSSWPGCRGSRRRVLCHTKGFGSSFQLSIHAVMTASNSLVERCVPRRSHLLVSSANQRSTRFIHDAVGGREVEDGTGGGATASGESPGVLWVETLSTTRWTSSSSGTLRLIRFKKRRNSTAR